LIKALPDMALKSVSLSPGKSGPRAGWPDEFVICEKIA
jgi:hypothetical protein